MSPSRKNEIYRISLQSAPSTLGEENASGVLDSFLGGAGDVDDEVVEREVDEVFVSLVRCWLIGVSFDDESLQSW